MKTISKNMRSQRGAMFGLDARIALAIFGGLSVVAGAAIISAITETGASALATELDNIQKGYVHYVLENSLDTLDESALFGVYVQGTTSHPKYGSYTLAQDDADSTADVLEASATTGTDQCAAGGALCFIWLRLTAVDSSVALELEKKYDDSTAANNVTASDNDAGTFRFVQASGGTNIVFYQLSRSLLQ